MGKLLVGSFLLSILLCCMVIQQPLHGSGPYFIETDRVLSVYKPLIDANMQVKVKDQVWRDQIKVYEDSLVSLLDSVSEHKRLADLELLNLETNVLRHNMVDSTSRLASKVLALAIDSFNVVTANYANMRCFDILFGAVNNTIVFGTGTKADKTSDFIEYLESFNE